MVVVITTYKTFFSDHGFIFSRSTDDQIRIDHVFELCEIYICIIKENTTCHSCHSCHSFRKALRRKDNT